MQNKTRDIELQVIFIGFGSIKDKVKVELMGWGQMSFAQIGNSYKMYL